MVRKRSPVRIRSGALGSGREGEVAAPVLYIDVAV
jgi:hypothetical protein